MAGVVLETLNVWKLSAFGTLMFIALVSFFVIGGLVSPSPNSSEQILMSRCVDYSGDSSKWIYVRHFESNGSGTNCGEILPDGDLDEVIPEGVDENQLVFVAQFPHPRDGYKLTMTRWFQQIIAVLMLDIKHKFGNRLIANDAKILFDLRLGYRNGDDPKGVWHELAHSIETRPLRCTPDPAAKDHLNQLRPSDSDFYYECEVIPLFSLASCHHEEYVLNLRIPKDVNGSLGQSGSVLQDVWMVEIHQNGGFTKIWFSLKTMVFPFSVLALCFFVYRVRELNRPFTVLDRTVVVLGSGLILLNCPVEWISLVWNSSFWIILSDIRQGFFFAVLACFLLVFTGEHMMDKSPSVNRVYWPRLLLVITSCTSLSIFELAERGVQIRNPFYSIWSHPTAAKLGIASIAVAAVCAAVYTGYLALLIFRALLQIFSKRRLLTRLPAEQCTYYKGVIYRFIVLISCTSVCAGLTIAFFMFNRLTEDRWTWGERSVEYGSAFITGVYGMWNVYVISILCLYAPSHKFRSSSGRELYGRLVSSTAVAATDPCQQADLDLSGRSEGIPLCPMSVDDSGQTCLTDEVGPTGPGGLKFLRKVAID
ncbi:unnamed protein product [Dicrocoelium dendriticum]|nr:unnamed protein product [Dicrocoelium dendriticum]